ncbi:RND multidrug efflux membrane fusion protein MexE precursor [Magnetococcus marinus MC-1]|uniref:RND multidrug efflux membrane fusion protein MexE n=1 Tax=Magnetococcus marinus (strain ATCC BAA-1437 / JCM 17883 / MC-1) TaxID=156889 RepID=A0LA68_MAGMM|nr:biotin/lipoyl-binding protein [Magnetococcus marinus]ABK44861.1 RND multidrug efflux membrane fusion protein MexE precursor [Magnetococcus marinus MC-1]
MLRNKIFTAVAGVWLTFSVAHGAERQLSFAVDGVVTRLLVKPGMQVQAGTPLAELDRRVFQAELEAATQQHKAATLNYELAQQGWQRLRQLYDDLNASKQELEEAQLLLARAKAEQAATHRDLTLAQWRLGYSQLVAPTAGRIQAIPGFVGQVLNAQSGMAPVIILETNIKE